MSASFRICGELLGYLDTVVFRWWIMPACGRYGKGFVEVGEHRFKPADQVAHGAANAPVIASMSWEDGVCRFPDNHNKVTSSAP